MPEVNVNGRRIRAYERKNCEAKTECDCSTTEAFVKAGQFVPSAAPDLNLIEMANGYLRQLVWEECSEGREEWKGSVAKKMEVVKRCTNTMNQKRSYWWKLYDRHDVRCQKIIDAEGEVLF